MEEHGLFLLLFYSVVLNFRMELFMLWQYLSMCDDVDNFFPSKMHSSFVLPNTYEWYFLLKWNEMNLFQCWTLKLKQN